MPYDPLWDDIDLEWFKDNKTYTLPWSQELLHVGPDVNQELQLILPLHRLLVGQCWQLLLVVKGRRRKGATMGTDARGYPQQTSVDLTEHVFLQQPHPGFNLRPVFITEVVKYPRLLFKTGLCSNVASIKDLR